MQTVLISGGSGMIGKRLTYLLLEKGYEVIILSRDKNKKLNNPRIAYALWDIKKNYIDEAAVKKADFIIHLAGAGVMDKRWSTAYKKEIVNSRVQSSQLLVDTLNKVPNQVKKIISASATGWYGPDKNSSHLFTEDDLPAHDFLAETCVAWEKSIEQAATKNRKIIILRTGIVLANEGGALASFAKPLKAGIAGIPGSGKQICSWIHIEDLCRMYWFAIENNSMDGSYNAVAPQPVALQKLIISLAENKRNKFYIPIHAPAFALQLLLGERSVEILKSTTVSCRKIKDAGFTFFYPGLQAALQQLAAEPGL